MRVYLGSDHAGYELKSHLTGWLKENGHEPVDCGPLFYDAVDDYPPFCLRAAERTAADPGALGIVIGGSGNGEAIAANKVRGVRCALAWSEETARLGREHNDANVVSIGARMHTAEEATAFVAAFLATPYSGEERHTRRIAMLTAYETEGTLPPLPPGHGQD
ncbi:ribose-5-phosphate isomerase [Streptomyces sp. DSM 44917]|uniref:Ribose-5-phosphate isomerase B n=1 Tax=Streptomyces boetiae TaxID=3075541 RepID=A0ABU2L4F9_9ACTN|nr:ribose-5-phosphate isomerase [Streptomyces sp. DSM 44917]MDT0306444.1 ribose-5-phosphate isomerase [Streptomyces sp. DSM 44917]